MSIRTQPVIALVLLTPDPNDVIAQVVNIRNAVCNRAGIAWMLCLALSCCAVQPVESASPTASIGGFETRFISADGLSTRYYDEGSGEPLLLALYSSNVAVPEVGDDRRDEALAQCPWEVYGQEIGAWLDELICRYKRLSYDDSHLSDEFITNLSEKS